MSNTKSSSNVQTVMDRIEEVKARGRADRRLIIRITIVVCTAMIVGAYLYVQLDDSNKTAKTTNATIEAPN